MWIKNFYFNVLFVYNKLSEDYVENIMKNIRSKIWSRQLITWYLVDSLDCFSNLVKEIKI